MVRLVQRQVHALSVVFCKSSRRKPWENIRLKGFLNQDLNHRSLRFLIWSLLRQATKSGGILSLCPVQEELADFFEGTYKIARSVEILHVASTLSCWVRTYPINLAET